jgi:hypothetical protein
MDALTRLALGGGSGPVQGSRDIVRAGFCSHRWQGVPWFDVFYCSVPDAGERRALLQWKQAHGLTHVTLAPRYQYDVITQVRPELGPRDLTWFQFTAYLEEVLNAGLFPIVPIIADLPTSAIYDGRLRDGCQALQSYAPFLWVHDDWEDVLGGGRDRPDIDTAILTMRDSLGDAAKILIHTRPTDDDGSDGHFTAARQDEDEQGWWDTPAGLECDGVFQETRHGANGPSYSDDPMVNQPYDPTNRPTWLGRWIEGIERFAAPGSVNYFGNVVRTQVMPFDDPNDPGTHVAPDWFSRPRKRGRPVCVAYENVHYEFARGLVSDERVARVTALYRHAGTTMFGGLGGA